MIRLLTALSLLVTPALALAQSATTTYYARTLENAPRPVVVSTGFLTVLQFYDKITQVASGRPDLIRVEVSGTRVYVSTVATTGSTDLVVEVGDRTQLFKVDIERGTSPRRYTVLDEPPPAPVAARPAPAAPPKASAPAPKAAAPPAPAPVVAARPAPATVITVRPAPAPSPKAAARPTAAGTTKAAAPRPAVPTSAIRPTSSASAAAFATPDAGYPVLERNPAWLQVKFVERDLDDAAGTLTLYYSLTNRGERPLSLWPGGVVARQGEASLAVELLQGTRAVLRPGKIQLGTLTLRGVRSGPLTLTLRVSDSDGQKAYLVERIVDASRLLALP